jgi:hypothetical protein
VVQEDVVQPASRQVASVEVGVDIQERDLAEPLMDSLE